MAARTLLPLLIILLGFSHLIFSNAIPVTRIERLRHGVQVHLPPGTNHMVRTENIWDAETIPERMDVELNDYPGSGANNRHTPKPQSGKCPEC
ncbi:Transmembrane protein [Parasponia andersonii]|uniref:Transmembrane protein n=1 Tax=Parasponia andersonii TaxID=3476 RepID=A0A2P5AJM4_PARAD|nr:Transmembrane protein [Parasponia andersonii]